MELEVYARPRAGLSLMIRRAAVTVVVDVVRNEVCRVMSLDLVNSMHVPMQSWPRIQRPLSRMK
jgi:hypothetical protein